MKIMTIYLSDVIFFFRLLSLVENWLGFESVSHGFLHERYLHFGTLGGFSIREGHPLNIVWLSSIWIIWNEHNGRIFQYKEENLQTL